MTPWNRPTRSEHHMGWALVPCCPFRQGRLWVTQVTPPLSLPRQSEFRPMAAPVYRRLIISRGWSAERLTPTLPRATTARPFRCRPISPSVASPRIQPWATTCTALTYMQICASFRRMRSLPTQRSRTALPVFDPIMLPPLLPRDAAMALCVFSMASGASAATRRLPR